MYLTNLQKQQKIQTLTNYINTINKIKQHNYNVKINNLKQQQNQRNDTNLPYNTNNVSKEMTNDVESSMVKPDVVNIETSNNVESTENVVNVVNEVPTEVHQDTDLNSNIDQKTDILQESDEIVSKDYDTNCYQSISQEFNEEDTKLFNFVTNYDKNDNNDMMPFSSNESLDKLIKLINTILEYYGFEKQLHNNLITTNSSVFSSEIVTIDNCGMNEFTTFTNRVKLIVSEKDSEKNINTDTDLKFDDQVNCIDAKEVIDAKEGITPTDNVEVEINTDLKEEVKEEVKEINKIKKSSIDFNKINKLNKINQTPCDNNNSGETNSNIKSKTDSSTSPPEKKLLEKMNGLVKKVKQKVETVIYKDMINYSDILNDSECTNNITGVICYIILDKIDKLIK